MNVVNFLEIGHLQSNDFGSIGSVVAASEALLRVILGETWIAHPVSLHFIRTFDVHHRINCPTTMIYIQSIHQQSNWQTVFVVSIIGLDEYHLSIQRSNNTSSHSLYDITPSGLDLAYFQA